MIALFVGVLLAIIQAEPPEPINALDLPAVLVVYDPALGGINCDEDCSTLATGPFEESMYGEVGACDQSLLGRTVSFPALDLDIYCGDTGGMIRPMWSDHYNQMVLYFDVLWPLADGADPPEWNYWLVEDWIVQ